MHDAEILREIEIRLREIDRRQSALLRALERIEYKMGQLETQGATMSADFADLTAEVQNEIDVEASAVKLIEGLATEIAANATDHEAVSALAAKIHASAASLAAAVAANTIAAPEPAPVSLPVEPPATPAPSASSAAPDAPVADGSGSSGSTPPAA